MDDKLQATLDDIIVRLEVLEKGKAKNEKKDDEGILSTLAFMGGIMLILIIAMLVIAVVGIWAGTRLGPFLQDSGFIDFLMNRPYQGSFQR